MIIRALSVHDVPMPMLLLTIGPADGAGAGTITTRTDASGIAQVDDDPPATFQVSARLADGSVMRSRVFARPDAFRSQVLTIKFNNPIQQGVKPHDH